MNRSLFIGLFVINIGLCASATGDGADGYTLDDIYEEGARLFEVYAPDEVKDVLEWPAKSEWDLFWRQLEGALASGDFEDLSWILPEVRTALQYLNMSSALKPYADWLYQRLDYCEMSDQVVRQAPSALPRRRPAAAPGALTPPKLPAAPPLPAQTKRSRSLMASNRTNWERKLAGRPAPSNARELLPSVKKIFSTSGVPDAWVWIAEVESSFNPEARSPVGAAGLFQFMPATGSRFGLRLSPVDERLDPAKSAAAAARYLTELYARFRSWPLVLAAYNAGEGRVGRLLKIRKASSFEEIRDELPVETQMYVPKVLATVRLREGVNPLTLPAPRKK